MKPNIEKQTMSSIEISNIDTIVQSWRYAMCVKCSIMCKGQSLYDLFISSSACKEKNHAISTRTSVLKGYGYLKSAVEYINATKKVSTNDIYEAKYHTRNAIEISNCYNDNLNINIKKLSLKLLKNINSNHEISKTINFFTLSELIELSNNEKNTVKTFNKTNKNKMTQNIHDLAAKRNVDTENINTICNTYSKSKNFTNQFKIILKERKSNYCYDHQSSKTCSNLYRNSKYLLFGGTNKRKRKRLNYANK